MRKSVFTPNCLLRAFIITYLDNLWFLSEEEIRCVFDDI